MDKVTSAVHLYDTLLLFVIGFVSFPGPMQVQTFRGAIIGTVLDQTGGGGPRNLQLAMKFTF